MNHLLVIQYDWTDYTWRIIGLFLFVAISLLFFKYFEVKEARKQNEKLFLPKQADADQIRYNTFLDSIEAESYSDKITMDEYRKAKEIVWKYEKQL